jgi:23S rRNA pseudouridine2605 synthase
MPAERLQKILAAAGFGSRRACEEMILDGRVAVNGSIMSTLPALADTESDRIAVDGKPVRSERHVYFILNKPAGVFCTQNDPAGRTRAVDLLQGVRERVYPVGRLDAESMGLLILTNDGALTQKLTHPRFGVPKTYRAEVQGMPTLETLEKVRAGVWLAEGRTAPAKIEIIHRQRDKAILEVTLRECRNREIRRMLAMVGHKVRRLTRIRMGRLSIAKLPLGAYRRLTDEEVNYLRQLAEKVGVEPAGFHHIADRPRRTRSPREIRDQRGGHQTARGAGTRERDRSRAQSGRPERRPARSTSSPRSQKSPRQATGRTASPRRRIVLPE